ncbi:glycosyltransferase family 8 protein [Marinomonas arenicola]|uniref:glycosyltransferase family 8 protein n=1 Tax=Marinomonas TaxID=28253 RepID=UPI0010551D17|nr:glycosyltransferase family 8 protein [Marinomonas sp. KMM3893]
MINIVLCSDENYAAYSATVMVSALENTSSREEFNFYLLTTGLTKETKINLERTVKHYGAKLSIINVDTSNFDSLNIDLGRFGIGTLLRLYMHRYLPEALEKVIYLDCDLVILGDLKELWEENLNNFPIGAIIDLCSPKSYKERQDNYFNAGVLLIDLNLWINNQLGEKALNYLIKHPDDANFLDQDALNNILKNQWKNLDLSWNFQPAAYSAHEKGYDYLESRKNELYNAIKKPQIVHFIGPIKPWSGKCVHPLQDLFIEFSKKTPWPIKLQTLRAELSIIKRVKIFFKKSKIKRRRKLTTYQK